MMAAALRRLQRHAPRSLLVNYDPLFSAFALFFAALHSNGLKNFEAFCVHNLGVTWVLVFWTDSFFAESFR